MSEKPNNQESRPSDHHLLPHEKRFQINPEDRLLADRCFPQYQWHAKNLIDGYLKFYPDEAICLPYEPILQALIAGYKSGQIDETEFAKETEIICRKIRNETLWQFKDVYKFEYDESDFAIYDSYLPHFKVAARDRLCSFFDVAPELQLSLYAELFVRELMREDSYYTDMDSSWHDNLAMSIVWYRYALRKNNCIKEADESFLLGDAVSRMWGGTAYYFLRKK